MTKIDDIENLFRTHYASMYRLAMLILPEPRRNERGYIIVDRSRFDEDELASENFRIIDNYYKGYGKFSTNSTYARRMARVIGDEEDQFKVDMQSLFEVGRYDLKQVKIRLNQLYARYGIRRRAKDNDLNEYGYKTKRVRPRGHVYIKILETPEMD